MKLIENAGQWWKLYSTWAMVALASIPAVWMELPPDVKDMVPVEVRPYIAYTLAAIGIWLRLVKQGPKP